MAQAAMALSTHLGQPLTIVMGIGHFPPWTGAPTCQEGQLPNSSPLRESLDTCRDGSPGDTLDHLPRGPWPRQ